MTDHVIVPSTGKATASIIFLHGLGDTGHGWAAGFDMLGLRNTRCIFPNAPMNKVTLNFGMRMPSWFDIKSLDRATGNDQDEDGINQSANLLTDLVEAEIKQGINPERIVIGGFSQGGAVALYTALAMDVKIGGVVALSTYLPLSKQFINPNKPKYNTNVPFLICHGEQDQVLNLKLGKMSYEVIREFVSNCTFNIYPGLEHRPSEKEMQDVKAFLCKVLKVELKSHL